MVGSSLEIASSWGLRSGHELDPDPEGQAAVHCPPTPGQFSRAEGAVEEVVPWRRVPRSQAEALPE